MANGPDIRLTPTEEEGAKAVAQANRLLAEIRLSPTEEAAADCVARVNKLIEQGGLPMRVTARSST